jgi:transcriptional regulator CtsR
MLLKYTDKFNIKFFKNIAKIYKIKYISYIKKTDLVNLINNYNASKIIQRYFRLKLLTCNECPISYKKLNYPFISFKVNKKFFYYDFETIVNYFIKSDNFVEPCTRHPISDKKIYEINELIKYYYGKNTNNILITSNMIKNAELNIITYCIYDIIRELDIVNKDEIKNILLPRFIYYINYLLINYNYDDISIILKACKVSFKDTILLEYLYYIEEKLHKTII